MSQINIEILQREGGKAADEDKCATRSSKDDLWWNEGGNRR